jgi:hypothetical protein
LLPPPVQPLDRSLGAIVGCFHVVSDSDDAHVLASCATALAPSQMPPPEAWEKEPWFDPHRARLFQTVSRTFGPRLWPDSGTLGSWTCQSVSLSPRAEVVALMRHETGLEAHLSCGLPGQHASCPEPALTVDVCLLPGTADPPKSWGPVEDLQRTVAALVTGKTPAPTPASHAARLGLVFMRLTGDGWSVHPAELPAGQFRFQLSLAGAGIDMCMAAFQPERIGKRVGNVVIRVHGGGHGPEADSFAKAVIATAQALQSVPPCPASLTAWRTALGRILYRMPSPLKGTWRVTWEPETSPRNGL